MHSDNKLMLEHIGKNFKKYRKESGYSRKEAAELIGVAPRTLAAYERGEREISTKLTVRLAEIYGTTFTKLTDYKTIQEYLYVK